MIKPLKHPLPPNRSVEQVWNHYQVESRLARDLMAADREGRQHIFATMYDELFAAVPDHPRLTRRVGAAQTDTANRSKLAALRPWLRKDAVLMEFAPGDGEFAAYVAPHVKEVVGVDISDQRRPGRQWPTNFRHVVYDGFNLPQVQPESIDLVFSDQLLEHLHPEDAQSHLELVLRCLRPGGRYVIRTPHAVTGPWDVSRFFCDRPEGFHLKEWTFRELRDALLATGYRSVETAWNAKEIVLRVPGSLMAAEESILGGLARRLPSTVARAMFPTVLGVGVK